MHPTGFGRTELDGPPTPLLFDLHADPLEHVDRADQEPEVVARLLAAYDAWFDDVSSTRPDNYAPPRIMIGADQEPITSDASISCVMLFQRAPIAASQANRRLSGP